MVAASWGECRRPPQLACRVREFGPMRLRVCRARATGRSLYGGPVLAGITGSLPPTPAESASIIRTYDPARHPPSASHPTSRLPHPRRQQERSTSSRWRTEPKGRPSAVGVLWDFSGTSGPINWHEHETAERSFALVSCHQPRIVAGQRVHWSLPGHLSAVRPGPPPAGESRDGGDGAVVRAAGSLVGVDPGEKGHGPPPARATGPPFRRVRPPVQSLTPPFGVRPPRPRSPPRRWPRVRRRPRPCLPRRSPGPT